MNFILVWVLVSTNSFSSAGFVNYSAPMKTQNECLIFKAKIEELQNLNLKHQCVQITMGVAK